MKSQCFIMQIATEDILLKVTNVCALCYDDIHMGDTIHYDTQRYHYLCQSCQEQRSELMNEECKIIEDEEGGLFC
ncbi:MAG: hypothetical protein HF962_05600 [Sulfurovum sp.]|nr:hypothetical protein [Sulfurovum sp.]